MSDGMKILGTFMVKGRGLVVEVGECDISVGDRVTVHALVTGVEASDRPHANVGLRLRLESAKKVGGRDE